MPIAEHGGDLSPNGARADSTDGFALGYHVFAPLGLLAMPLRNPRCGPATSARPATNAP